MKNIIIVIIAVILAGGAMLFILTSSSETSKPKGENIQELMEMMSNHYNLFLFCGYAGTTEDKIQRCMQISDRQSKYREKCLYSIRPITVEVCDSVPSSFETHTPEKDSCYLNLALKEENDKLCDKIDGDLGLRINCYWEIARAKKDATICEKIDYNYLKTWCQDNATKSLCHYGLKYVYEDSDEEGFNRIYGKYKDLCIAVVNEDISRCGGEISCHIKIAEDTNDLSICEKMETGSDSCYAAMAALREDASICDKMKTGSDYCYTDIAFIEAQKKDTIDVSLCDMVKGDNMHCYANIQLFYLHREIEELIEKMNEEELSFFSDYCDKHILDFLPIDYAEEKDITLCQELKERLEEMEIDEMVYDIDIMSSVDECYMKTAAGTGDVSICDELITSDYFKHRCYHEVAKTNKDATLCEKTDRDKGICYRDLAKILKDESICEKIDIKSAGPMKVGCFQDLAIIKNDPTICDRIVETSQSMRPPEERRKACYRQFNDYDTGLKN